MYLSIFGGVNKQPLKKLAGNIPESKIKTECSGCSKK
jgi:hypothetical protein